MRNWTVHSHKDSERAEGLRYGDHAVLSITRNHGHISDQYCKQPPEGYVAQHRMPTPVFGNSRAFFNQWFVGMVIYNRLNHEFDRVTEVRETGATSMRLT